MTHPLNPGFCEDTGLIHLSINQRRAFDVLDFAGDITDKYIVDIGEPNTFKYILETFLGDKEIHSINVSDLNFDQLAFVQRPDIIFCFEVLEHLQNPLFLMKNIRDAMHKDSIIYLSMPCKPFFLLGSHHYFEIPPKHFQKWILTPLGLTIKKKMKVSLRKNWTEILIGFRPLYRLFTKKEGYKEILTTLFYNYTILYEIMIKKE